MSGSGCHVPTCGLALLSELGGECHEYGCLDWESGSCKFKTHEQFERAFNRAHKEVWKRIRAHWLKEPSTGQTQEQKGDVK